MHFFFFYFTLSQRKNILERYHKNGKTLVLIFPDGTGHVLYPFLLYFEAIQWGVLCQILTLTIV